MLEICRNGNLATVNVTIHEWPEAKPIVLNDNGPDKLGLQLVSAPGQAGKQNVMVAAVDPAGTAADSGIQKGDIIVAVQQTTVSNPDQALHLFHAQSSDNHHFAAVLVERDKKLTWIPIAVPD